VCFHLDSNAHSAVQNRTWDTFTEDSARNKFSALLMAALWFGGTMVYGIGESLLGDLGAVCSILSLLHLVFFIIMNSTHSGARLADLPVLHDHDRQCVCRSCRCACSTIDLIA
jgi:hypothetical protein